MFNIDEKSIADNRTLLTIQDTKAKINPITKNGTVHYSMDGHNLWLTTPKIRQAYINKDVNLTNYYDKVVLARDGINIDGKYSFDDDIIFKNSIEIKRNLVIKGDFTVEGNSSIIDTPRLTIEDNVIELNRNEKTAGITLGISGTAINRGTKPFARYLYSETNKAFVLDAEPSMDAPIGSNWVLMAHTEDSDSNIAGEVRIFKKLSSPLVSCTDLTASKSATIKDLIVTGSSATTGNSEFLSSVTVNGQFTAKSNSQLDGTLTVNRTSLFKDAVTLNKTLTVDDISTFKKLATFQQGLTISAIGANITGALSVTGNSTLTGTLTTTENAQFNKDVNITSTLTAANLTATVKTKTLDAEITRDLSVARNSTLTGTVAINNNLTVTASKTTLNSPTEITGDTQITAKDLRLTCATDGTKGDLFVDGDANIKKTLTVDGTTNLKGNVSLDNDLIANKISARNNLSVLTGDGQGLQFWDSDAYKIYMSATGHASAGSVAGSSTSDYNMYFKMSDGTNRGFVFKNNSTSLVQIESTGKLRAIEHIFAKGSQVLRHADMGHQPANNTAINACMVDGKHSTDLVLRDGSQKMTGDLNLDNFKLRWANDDYIEYNDAELTIGSQTYAGRFNFYSDSTLNGSAIEVGGLKAGSLGISGKDNTVYGVTNIQGAFGTIVKSTDEWLRINDDNTHSNGIFTGTSLIRTDNAINIGDGGSTLLANSTSFKYKNFDVVTTNGATMLGNLNMHRSKLLFNADSSEGTFGVSSTDVAEIYGEHDENTENSRLVFRMADNNNDSFVFRNVDASNQKDTLIINHNRATFSDNPYFGSNRLLHAGDLGSGKLLDADMIDGKHYSDLANDFINAAGDTMTGTLTMNNSINMTALNKINFNGLTNSYMRAGGTGNNSLVLSSSDLMYFFPGGDSSKQMLLQTDGNLSVRGSNVLRVADEGHGNGIDADTIDGQHLTDLDNRFVNATGDTMTGNLTLSCTGANLLLVDDTAKIRSVVSNGKSYIQAGKTDADNAGSLNLTGNNGTVLSELNVLVADKNNAKINGSKILTESDEGHGKGIDADTLDGKHVSELATSNHNHDTAYTKKEEVDLQSKYKIKYNDVNNSLDFMYIV